jgi:hypothetical protein
VDLQEENHQGGVERGEAEVGRHDSSMIGSSRGGVRLDPR